MYFNPQRVTSAPVTWADALLIVRLSVVQRPHRAVIAHMTKAPESDVSNDVTGTDNHHGPRHLIGSRCNALTRPLDSAQSINTDLSDHEHALLSARGRRGYSYLSLGCSVDNQAIGMRPVAKIMARSQACEALTTRKTEELSFVARSQCEKSMTFDIDVAVGAVKVNVKVGLAKDGRGRMQAAIIAALPSRIEGPVYYV